MENKAKTRQQFANEYGVSVKTLSRWIKRRNLCIENGLLTPATQNVLYDSLGLPFFANKTA
ncbi:helix-turn-helix domain-containing protein [Algoriphagus chordae]|uniref:DNA-binding protein n=1 Tax=Algoriphagus chordae TaxID=237019 RepID=A0A2W7QN24_9BACT|nr:helix-turn-helix domain-containing protein [Algoriphagus chordae]PZX48676.1 hypothetical protein LV85_03490 [Algoriphagus chordae]